MLKKSFKCSYLNIDTKLNKKDYIKMDKKQIQEEKKHVQFLSKEEKNEMHNIINRDLLGSTCDKLDLQEFYMGKFI
ncbi:hypothetical protein AAJ76_500084689 [Vairimorpha ceranae]|uniref:Uncharacterized protein n=1 Tax=Vairimorpha ceranae TaxID=40302 RepID=A0A0F9WTW0_9MICR|nr:hypothetical protein AAJ76_500084689 [Vairimorpha ceranae]KKO76253.1 hypothetical protein AAJ76_500084689 [Vairimorpha ceranae]